MLRRLDDEIAGADKRIAALYDEADPKGIVARPLGSGPSLAAILGNAGDFNRFANLAGVAPSRALCPRSTSPDWWRHTRASPRQVMPACARPCTWRRSRSPHRPTLAQRYYRLVMVEGKHHNSALCSVSAVLITRIAACWRKGELYQLRDEDGEAITEAEGKAACADRFKIDPKVRAARRRNTRPKSSRTGRRVEAERSRPGRSLRPPTRREKKLAKMWLEGLDCR